MVRLELGVFDSGKMGDVVLAVLYRQVDVAKVCCCGRISSTELVN